MNFPCKKCGLCCKMLHNIPILSDHDKGNGTCRYLVTNLCSIYENRPLICNIEKAYLSFFKETMTEQEFININIDACIQIAEYFDNSWKESKEENLCF